MNEQKLAEVLKQIPAEKTSTVAFKRRQIIDSDSESD